MRRTSVYLRPDAREADLVRVGTLYLSRTSDRQKIHIQFLPADGLEAVVAAATESEGMRVLMHDFTHTLLRTLPATNFPKFECEEEVVEALFRLLPTNMKHDEIEDYPAEDFFVRAIRELDRDALTPDAIVDAAPA
jgi:hypothetical protein